MFLSSLTSITLKFYQSVHRHFSAIRLFYGHHRICSLRIFQSKIFVHNDACIFGSPKQSNYNLQETPKQVLEQIENLPLHLQVCLFSLNSIPLYFAIYISNIAKVKTKLNCSTVLKIGELEQMVGVWNTGTGGNETISLSESSMTSNFSKLAAVFAHLAQRVTQSQRKAQNSQVSLLPALRICQFVFHECTATIVKLLIIECVFIWWPKPVFCYTSLPSAFETRNCWLKRLFSLAACKGFPERTHKSAVVSLWLECYFPANVSLGLDFWEGYRSHETRGGSHIVRQKTKRRSLPISTWRETNEKCAVLRSEIPSSMCAKLRTVAASNNRDHARNLSYHCLLALHIWWFHSSRTSRSWWIIQSTQHYRRGCNSSNSPWPCLLIFFMLICF